MDIFNFFKNYKESSGSYISFSQSEFKVAVVQNELTISAYAQLYQILVIVLYSPEGNNFITAHVWAAHTFRESDIICYRLDITNVVWFGFQVYYTFTRTHSSEKEVVVP